MANTELFKKIGQMLIMGFRGCTIENATHIKRLLSKGQLGGVILFIYDVASGDSGRNIESPTQLIRLIKSIKELSEVPPFIAIDEEGGQVSRLKSKAGFNEFRSHQQLGDTGNPEETYREALKIAYHLDELGFNLNFAPCVDLAINPDNPIIYKKERSFSEDPEVVFNHAKHFIRAHDEQNILTSPKHFPGHGSAIGDTHLGMVDVTRDWQEKELRPYQMLIEAGLARIVMASHIFHRKIDPSYPASLSQTFLISMLRIQIGFKGVIISDDLEMKAISQHFGFEEAIARAINAGVDILLLGNNLQYDPDLYSKVFNAFENLLDSGRITEERIDESYQRIVHLKETMI